MNEQEFAEQARRLAEFAERVRRFDWFFDFSDDHRVWLAGERALGELVRAGLGLGLERAAEIARRVAPQAAEGFEKRMRAELCPACHRAAKEPFEDMCAACLQAMDEGQVAADERLLLFARGSGK